MQRRVIAWTLDQHGSRVVFACGHLGPMVRETQHYIDFGHYRYPSGEEKRFTKRGTMSFVSKRIARRQRMHCEECEAIDKRERADDGITGE